MDFSKTILEYREQIKRPLLVAHRGASGANIPPNTLAAFQIALDMGADVIELDVAISKDHKYYVFHPGTEELFIKCGKQISEMDSCEVDSLYLLNDQDAKTSYHIPKLSEAFSFLKGKCYINVDKFWTDIEGISREIRLAGVEKQVIVKTNYDEILLSQIELYASDFMYMVINWHKDSISDNLLKKNIHYIGMECLFQKETEDICSKTFIQKMHNRGLVLWANAIIYDEAAVIAANKTDDISLTQNPDLGWGWLAKQGFDMIQTDWISMCKKYLEQNI